MAVLPLQFTAATYPTIDGTWKNFVIDYSAPTNGTSDASAALDLWLADGTATKLYMPNASDGGANFYNLTGTNTLTGSKAVASVYAVGVSVPAAWVGPVVGTEFAQTSTARVNSVSAGADTVTLKNTALISRFTAGKYVMMCGLHTQALTGTNINGSGWVGSGDPPNWHFFEYLIVASKTSSTVTFTTPLRNSYLDTWPEFNSGSGLDYGGPAMLCAMPDEWDADVKIYGLTNTQADFATIRGRKILLQGCYWTGEGPSWSLVKDGTLLGGSFGGGEVDKLNESIHYHHASGSGNLVLQSSSNDYLTFSMCSIASCNGLAKKTTISRSTFGDIRVGPAAYGAGESLSVSDSTIPSSARIVARAALPISAMTFSGGTLSILKTDTTNCVHVIECAVPGEKWGMCYNDTSRYFSENLGSVSFTVTAFREDASKFYVDTDLVSLPAPTFDGGNPATHFFNWPADTITQTNSGPGDLTAFVAP